MRFSTRVGAIVVSSGFAMLALGRGGPATRPADAPPLVALTKERDGDFRIGLPYAPCPELTVKAGVPKGRVVDFEMASAESKIYPTSVGTGRGRGAGEAFTRRVALYVPAQYAAGTEAAFMVIQDGVTQARLPGAPATAGGFYHDFLPTIMDNMIHERRLPVMLLVLIQPGPGDGPGSQRGLEYDTVSDTYTMFIEKEVLPKIEKEQGVKFTKDPEGRGAAGGSSGAACAFTMAWTHPELYRKVLSYSGTFCNQAQNEAAPHGAWDYHENFIAKEEKKPIRVWLHVSERDNGFNSPAEGRRNWVVANQKMAEVLKAKGYAYQYVLSEGVGHVPRVVLAATMAEAMEWLWAGYVAK